MGGDGQHSLRVLHISLLSLSMVFSMPVVV
jgi:hypothetical protein